MLCNVKVDGVSYLFLKKEKNVKSSIECHTNTPVLIRKHVILTDNQQVLLDQFLLVPGAESSQQSTLSPTAMCAASSGHRSVPVKRYIRLKKIKIKI